MQLSTRFRFDLLTTLLLVAGVALICDVAQAADAFELAENGIVKACRWYQKIVLTLIVVAWAGNAASRLRPGKAEAAREFMYDHLIPASAIGSATVAIAQVFKTAMGGATI